MSSGRRNFLMAGAGFAAVSLLNRVAASAQSREAQPALGGSCTNDGRLTNTQRRKLGSLEVSALGLGCMSMVAGFYNPAPPRQEMIAHIRAAVERGVTFFGSKRSSGEYSAEPCLG